MTTSPTTITNVEQARAWDGEEGDDWTENVEHYDASAHRHDPYLLDAAQIRVDDHVLDIGCGCGISTRAAARIALAGAVLGVDLSARMLEYARERSRTEGFTNITYEQVDAQVHGFEAHAFDVAISRFGAMFFGDPVAAFRNIARGVRPGGRLALLAWQELARNEWVAAIGGALAMGRKLPEPPAGAPGPFGLADPLWVRGVLTHAGFVDVELTDVEEPMYFGADTDDAFRFVVGLGITRGLLDGLDEAARKRALKQLRATLAAHEAGDGVYMGTRAWVITACANRALRGVRR